MTDDEFLVYCSAHSITPRRLFSGTQIHRLLRMLPESHPMRCVGVAVDPDKWYSEDLRELVLEIRKKGNV